MNRKGWQVQKSAKSNIASEYNLNTYATKFTLPEYQLSPPTSPTETISFFTQINLNLDIASKQSTSEDNEADQDFPRKENTIKCERKSP